LKNRQYSVKVLETVIDDEDKFIEFFNAHYVLFKDHLIVINGEISTDIKNYLEEKELNYLNNITLPVGRSRKSLEEELQINKDSKIDIDKYVTLEKKFEELETENNINRQIAQNELKTANLKIEKLSKKLNKGFTVLDTIIRSGRELNIEGDLLILNRVNSGATVKTSGNLIITQVVEGALRCDGNFMMITVSPKANIVFNGVVVDNSLLENKLNRIELKNREIHITPVIKKEINWAQ